MKYAFLISFLSLFLSSSAQDTTTIYYTQYWTKTSKEKAVYYRKAYQNEKKDWLASDYFLDGTLQMTGQYKSSKRKKKDGFFVFYRENGSKKSEGEFSNNKKNGEWMSFDTNGVLVSKCDYQDNHKEGNWTKFYEGKQLKQTGFYNSKENKEGKWTGYYENGHIEAEGNFVNGNKEGDWVWYHENGQISSEEIYLKDEMISFKYSKPDGSKMSTDAPYMQNPEYVGGMDSLYSYLSASLVYPEEAINNNIQGKVVVYFVVGKKGEIVGVKIARSVHSIIDAEAINVVEGMPNWIPGKVHNLPARVGFNLPIVFDLQAQKRLKKIPESAKKETGAW